LQQSGVVEFRQLVQQNADRPTVEYQVMYVQRKDMFVMMQADNCRAEQRPFCQIVPPSIVVLHDALQLQYSIDSWMLCHAAQVDDRHSPRTRRYDTLRW
jgi:hypothetical protein